MLRGVIADLREGCEGGTSGLTRLLVIGEYPVGTDLAPARAILVVSAANTDQSFFQQSAFFVYDGRAYGDGWGATRGHDMASTIGISTRNGMK